MGLTNPDNYDKNLPSSHKSVAELNIQKANDSPHDSARQCGDRHKETLDHQAQWENGKPIGRHRTLIT